jgi:hypothetical protein
MRCLGKAYTLAWCKHSTLQWADMCAGKVRNTSPRHYWSPEARVPTHLVLERARGEAARAARNARVALFVWGREMPPRTH